MPVQIFVSYARNDDLPPIGGGDGFVSVLVEMLNRAFAGFGPPKPAIWRDTHAIKKSQQFEPRLQEEIERSDLLLLVLSNNWMASEWCRKELETFEAHWKHEGERAVKERIIVAAKQHFDFDARPKQLQGQDGYKFYAERNGRHEEFFGVRGKLSSEFCDLTAELARDLWELAREREGQAHQRRASDAFVRNLPEEVSSFIGRKNEAKHVTQALHDKRIVTILGPAGVGKTRLALHVATEIGEQFPAGVWFVELSALTGNDVAVAVANSMNLPLAGRDPLASILQRIGKQPALIVLDNSENVVADCAKFCETVLRASPAPHILVTSRERLRVSGEEVFPLEPLPVPVHAAAFEALRKCDSVKLLVERATSVSSRFRLTEANAADIARICHEVDGIPLAIEIAAARLGMFSPEEVANRLKEQFALIAEAESGSDTHRTLRGTIEWSYRLLSDKERRLLARMAILRGIYPLDAVEQICADARVPRQTIFETLRALYEKSFVASVGIASSRFRMLHIIRAYGEERLRDLGEYEALAQRHFTYYFALVAGLASQSSTAQKAALDAVEQSHIDVMSALEWAREQSHEQLATLAGDLCTFWRIRGYLGEGSRQLESIAELPALDAPTRSQMLVRASHLRNGVGEFEAAEKDAEEAVRICEAQNPAGLSDALAALAGILCNCGSYDRALELFERVLSIEEQQSNGTAIISCLINLGIAHTGAGHYDLARASIERSIPIAQEHNATALIAWAYGALGNADHHAGQLAAAYANYARCLEISRSLDYRLGIAQAINHMAKVLLLQDKFDDARTLIAESLAMTFEHELWHQLADALEVVATLAISTIDDVSAARLFGAIDALRLRMRFPFTPLEQQARAHILEPLLARHDTGWLHREREAGQHLSLEALRRTAKSVLAHKPRTSHSSPHRRTEVPLSR